MSILLKPPSLIAYAVILVVLSFGIYFFAQSMADPVDPSQTDTQIFVIKKGQAVDSIGQSLQEAGLIKSPLGFKYVVARHGLSKNLQAGTFRLSPSMSSYEIAQELTHGTLDTWVTLIEGWRREEMAAALAAAFAEHGVDFDEDEFLTLTKGQEGYLFPDTYLFPLSADEEMVVSVLANTFNQKVTQGLAQDIANSNLTLNQILTLASLVEREANTDESRKIVAGILLNRLNNDWPLQVDATLQFVLGYDPVSQSWWKPPTVAQKELNSPYNTYQNPGLPPAPIASPSLASIEAVLSPTPTDYWYYLTGNDGNMYYAKTLEQHNQNIANYLR